ncbi:MULTISPECIES: hypothetical protein [Metallibacterium]|nr:MULTISPECIES: hypothetical protein [Metallibacterium]
MTMHFPFTARITLRICLSDFGVAAGLLIQGMATLNRIFKTA